MITKIILVLGLFACFALLTRAVQYLYVGIREWNRRSARDGFFGQRAQERVVRRK